MENDTGLLQALWGNFPFYLALDGAESNQLLCHLAPGQCPVPRQGRLCETIPHLSVPKPCPGARLPPYREVVAEELGDAGEGHAVVIVLHDAAAQQPDPLLPHPGGRALHVVQQLPRLAALQVAAHAVGQVESSLAPEGVKDNDNSNDGEDDDNPAARQSGVTDCETRHF